MPSSWPPRSPTSVRSRPPAASSRRNGPPDLSLEPTARHPGANWVSGAERPFLVGFAAETSDVEAHGREKLLRKGADVVVANEVGREGTGFGSDTNRAAILTRNGHDKGCATGRNVNSRPPSWTAIAARNSARADVGHQPAARLRRMSRGLPVHLRIGHRGPSRQAGRPDLRLHPRCVAGQGSRGACRLRNPGHHGAWHSSPGEITTKAWVDVPQIVRNTIVQVGYTDAKFGLDGDTCGVMTAIQEQSPDIAQGVDDALEHREGHSGDSLDASARATRA